MIDFAPSPIVCGFCTSVKAWSISHFTSTSSRNLLRYPTKNDSNSSRYSPNVSATLSRAFYRKITAAMPQAIPAPAIRKSSNIVNTAKIKLHVVFPACCNLFLPGSEASTLANQRDFLCKGFVLTPKFFAFFILTPFSPYPYCLISIIVIVSKQKPEIPKLKKMVSVTTETIFFTESFMYSYRDANSIGN